MIFDFVREDFLHYVGRIDRSKVELRLVIGQRSQHFLLDLLIFGRVHLGAIVGAIKHGSNVIIFYLDARKIQ